MKPQEFFVASLLVTDDKIKHTVELMWGCIVPLRSSQFNSFKLHSNKSAFLLNHVPGRTSKNVDGGPLVFLEGLNPYWERIRFYAAA